MIDLVTKNLNWSDLVDYVTKKLKLNELHYVEFPPIDKERESLLNIVRESLTDKIEIILINYYTTT